MSADKDMEKREHLYIIDRKVNWSSPMENSMRLLKELYIELLHGSAILLLGICPMKMKSLTPTYVCIITFFATLFTIVKIWKQVYQQTSG